LPHPIVGSVICIIGISRSHKLPSFCIGVLPLHHQVFYW
jgi:hypothetical protein